MANPLLVAATWALALPLVILLGTPIARIAGSAGPTFVRVSMWCGLALLTVVITLANQWLPLRGPAALLVVVAVTTAAALTGLSGSGWRRIVAVRTWRRIAWPVWLLLGIVVVVLAVGSSLSPTHYDFGLYHFQMVRLAADFPAIPGQANLLSYLGYANTEFPWAAFLMNGPAGSDGYRAVNGLFLLCLLADLVLRMSGRARGPGLSVATMNVLVAFVPLLVFADLLLASPTSDTAVFVLTLASTAGLAQAVHSRHVSSAAVLVCLTPLLVAVSMRPQMAIVLVGSIVVLSIVSVRNGLGRRAGRSLAVLALLCLGFVAAVLARDFRLSGWAVYPLSLHPFDVAWRAPDPTPLRTITIAIARDPGPAYQEAAHGWGWLPAWLLRQPAQWEFWFALALALLSIAVLVWARGRGPLRLRRLALLLAPSAAFMAAWITVLPPTWRLAWGPAFAAGSAAIGWGLHTGRADPARVQRGVLTVVALVAVLCAFVRYPGKPTELPAAPARTATLPSGLEVTVPTLTDQCWDNPLPCTPEPDDRLRLLGETLGDGLTTSPR